MNLQYRAVGNRCAVHLPSLGLPISDTETTSILIQKGFREIKVDLIILARECIGISQYSRGARLREAPAVVDCSSFIKWLYGKRGIWLPRRSIQQSEIGERIESNEKIAGDVIFTSGALDYYLSDPREGIGHVGIATGEGTIIHAANSKVNVIESSFEAFTEPSKLRSVRRYIPLGVEVLTFETPPEREVETSDDMKWIVLQSLPQ